MSNLPFDAAALYGLPFHEYRHYYQELVDQQKKQAAALKGGK